MFLLAGPLILLARCKIETGSLPKKDRTKVGSEPISTSPVWFRHRSKVTNMFCGCWRSERLNEGVNWIAARRQRAGGAIPPWRATRKWMTTCPCPGWPIETLGRCGRTRHFRIVNQRAPRDLRVNV